MTVQRSRGFSLIELLFAVFILATALIMVIAMFLEMLNSSEKSVDLTAGSVVADALLNQTIYQITTDPNATFPGLGVQSTFWATSKPTNPYLGGTYTLNNQLFQYQINAYDVSFAKWDGAASNSPTIPQSPFTGGNIQLKRMDCVVWWWSSTANTGQNEHHMGQLQVQMSRLVWPTAPY